MPSTYTLNNGIELIATGEQSGTWGDTTNTNMSLLDTALDGQVTVTLASAGTSGSPNTLPISDGAVSDGRNRMVFFNDGADLGATAYVQLTPNDAEKIVYIRNALSGSRSIIVFQGTYNASNDYEIPAGTTAVVYFNGGGTGAVAANVFNNAHFDALNIVGAAAVGTTLTVGTSLNIASSTTVDGVLDEDDMSSDSATKLATQQSIKAYVDSQVGTVDTWAEVLANGNTTGATDAVVTAGQKLTTNTIDETTAASGVTIDSVLLKDGGATLTDDLVVNTDNLFVDTSASKTMFGTTYNADSGNVTIRGTYGANNASDYRGNNALALTGADPGTTAAGSGINLAFVPVTNRGATAIISGENTGTNKEGGAQLRFSVGGSSFPTTQKDMLMLNYDNGAIFNEGSADLDFRVESDSNTHALFVDGGADRVVINSSSGQALFHVEGDQFVLTASGVAQNGIHVASATQAADGTYGGAISFDTGGLGASGVAAVNDGPSDIDSNGLAFFTHGSGTGGADAVERMRISYEGYVGINESDPQALLHVSQGLNDTATRIRIENTDTSIETDQEVNSIEFYSNDASASGTGVSGKIAQIAANPGNQYDLAFYTYNTSLAEAMRLTENGNMGVGESEPEAKLHVKSASAGTFSASGSQVLIENNTTVRLTMVSPNTNGCQIEFGDVDDQDVGRINYDHTNNYFQFTAGAQPNMAVIGYQGTVFNENSYDADFRVESDTNSHMLYMDSGNNRVNIGTTDVSSQGTLAVNGSAIFGRSSTTTGDFISSGGGNNDTYNGVAILSNSDQITAQANTSLSSWIVDIGGRASDGVTYPVSTRDAFGVRRVAAGGTYYGAANYLQIDAGEAVFNEDSNDQDFRVESDANSHFLFVDAGVARLGIGTSGPQGSVHLKDITDFNGSDVFYVAQNTTANRNAGFKVMDESDNYTSSLTYDNGSNAGVLTLLVPSNGSGQVTYSATEMVVVSNNSSIPMKLSTNSTERLRLNAGSDGAVFNELSNNYDFRVESDSNTHMFFLDASANRISIGTSSTGDAQLTVQNENNAYNTQKRSATTISGAGTRAAMLEGVYCFNTTSSGNQLSIPVFSQSSNWKPYYVELIFQTGEYNAPQGPIGGRVIFEFRSLTSLSGLNVLLTEGNVSGMAVSGMNLLVNFTTAYNSGLADYEGVMCHARVFGSAPQYIELDTATLN